MEADLTAIDSASRQISATHTAITGYWRELSGSADRLFGGSWRGFAANSYREPWDECTRGYQDILDGLKLLGESVAKAAENYNAQEHSSAETMNSAPAGLNL